MSDPQNTDFISLPWLHAILLLLAGVAGSVDAMGYFKLGHVLTANMTGNSVLLGLAIGQGKMAPAIRALTALIGFIVGVALGAAIVNRSKRHWHTLLSISLMVEFGLILAMAALWWAFMDVHPTAIVFASIVLSSIAMGMQSGAIHHLRIPGVVTTYLTGTITVVISELVKNFKRIVQQIARPGKDALPSKLEDRIGLQVLVFTTYLGVAAITALVYKQGLDFLPIFPLVLLLGAIVIITRGQKKHST